MPQLSPSTHFCASLTHLNLTLTPEPQERSQGAHEDQADQPHDWGQPPGSHRSAPFSHTLQAKREGPGQAVSLGGPPAQAPPTPPHPRAGAHPTSPVAAVVQDKGHPRRPQFLAHEARALRQRQAAAVQEEEPRRAAATWGHGLVGRALSGRGEGGHSRQRTSGPLAPQLAELTSPSTQCPLQLLLASGSRQDGGHGGTTPCWHWSALTYTRPGPQSRGEGQQLGRHGAGRALPSHRQDSFWDVPIPSYSPLPVPPMQGCKLQGTLSWEAPRQGAPPFLGGGSTQLLRRIWWPPPQDTLQGPQASHSVHVPSTVGEGRKPKGGWGRDGQSQGGAQS